jgi:hypothetical protein
VHIEVTKIKVSSKDEVTVEYVTFSDDPSSSANVRITSSESPLPSLLTAMNALLEDCAEICGLDCDWIELGRVTGVTFKSTEDGIACVVSLQRQVISPKPVNLNTPYLSGGEITEQMNVKLGIIREEVVKYINGEKALKQLSLFA